jgi:lysophospholipase L1-like esterase
MKTRALILSVLLNLVFLAGVLTVVKVKGSFAYLWIKTSSMIRGQGFHRDYNPHYFHRKELFDQLPTQTGDTLFIGDSLVEHCEWADLLQDNNVRNRGIAGDDTLGVLHRVERIHRTKPPRRILLMVGINDLFRHIPEKRILANYEAILKRIQTHVPSCKVLVHSLLPIDERLAPQPIESAVIQSLNDELQELCGKLKIDYLDCFEAFDPNDDGRLDEKFSLDGLHLNARGYMMWKQLLELKAMGKP